MRDSPKTFVPDFLMMSDGHATEETPRCRRDNYFEAQKRKWSWITELQARFNGCPVLHAGDLFDHWKASPRLLTMMEQVLPDPFYTVIGQHDLPNHDYNSFGKSALNHLAIAERVRLLEPAGTQLKPNVWAHGFSYGVKMREAASAPIMFHVAVTHRFLYAGEEPWKNCGGDSASAFLKAWKSWDLILSGDNHDQFECSVLTEKVRRFLINPGSLMRMETTQRDNRPAVYGFNVKLREYRRYEIPVNMKMEEVFEDPADTPNTEEVREKMDAFVQAVKSNIRISTNFTRNVRRYLDTNPVHPKVHKWIMKALEAPEE